MQFYNILFITNNNKQIKRICIINKLKTTLIIRLKLYPTRIVKLEMLKILSVIFPFGVLPFEKNIKSIKNGFNKQAHSRYWEKIKIDPGED